MKKTNVRQSLPLWMVIAVLFMAQGFSSCQQAKTEGRQTIGADTLRSHWKIQSSDSLHEAGAQISLHTYQATNWYPAKVPTTVLNTLVCDGVYHDIFRDENLKHIPSQKFKASWWYRTSFALAAVHGNYLLNFQGINYKANIWLNGNLLADTNSVDNAFRQYTFNVTQQLTKGKNTLAVQVFPPKPGDFSIGFVDWNPAAPDKDMGIFRPVILYHNGGVEISEPYVETVLGPGNASAALHISLQLSNHLSAAVSGVLQMEVAGKRFMKAVTLPAGKSKVLHFSPNDFPELLLKHPHLWWPHTFGTPYLYKAAFSFKTKQGVLDKKSIDFGVRKVSSFWTKAGHRGVMINGKKILVRGGGWVDNLLLNDSTASLNAQLNYVKDMGLNAIRLEGFWGNSAEMYKLCDEKGIMILVGWSCQWEWENLVGKACDNDYGGILTNREMHLISEAWKDQILWLRNHPSIIAWFSGSDKKPHPTLEKKYFKILRSYDTSRIYLASAKEWSSLAGPTGVKMRGPYAYEPPVYWFADTLYGGAFGFNTETGPGAQVPPLESLKKMFSPPHYWPIDTTWNFHSGRGIFNTIDRFRKAVALRYGRPSSLEDFARKAQVLNYELMRPMFEAFSAHRFRATGVIQWMLNSAWPELYWQLYDAYLMPNGAYYGAKKANQPLHVVYDYSQNTLYLVNDRLRDANHLAVHIRIVNLASKVVFDKTVTTAAKANSALKLFHLPDHLPLTKTYFLDLKLTDTSGKTLDNNFYWLSTQKDLLDYHAKVKPWNYYTPSKQYADFKALNKLPATTLTYRFSQAKQKKGETFMVHITNTGKHLAFFVHAGIMDQKGNTILPVIWSDNYISLLPGESRTLMANIKSRYLKNKNPQLKLDAYNKVNMVKKDR
jgi:exo-1,4-beta-D-glucosaminidase